jgi:hypothetical protein
VSDPVPPGLLDIAGHLLPGTCCRAPVAGHLLPGADLAAATLVAGGSHDVVLLPGIAAVRIARHDLAAAKLPDLPRVVRRS